MKVFSLKKYKEDSKNWKRNLSWAELCDGQPVNGGRCIGKDGVEYGVVNDWCEELPENKLIFKGNETILIKDGKEYVSKCADGDVYDKEIGLLLCLAKANAKPEAENTVKEVKRQAKEGEYIKIVRESNTSGCYKNGDILKVVERDKVWGVYVATEKTHACCIGKREGQSFVRDSEYVVLENYKPYKITLSEFWKSKDKLAIHCKTEDEAKELLKAFDKAGEKWRAGDKYTEYTEWGHNGEKTIYTNLNGYASIEGFWVKEHSPAIYEFNEVDLNN